MYRTDSIELHRKHAPKTREKHLSANVGGMPRPDVVGVSYRFHATPSKTSFGNSSKTFQHYPTVGSLVKDLLTRFSSVVGGMAQPDAVDVSYRFHPSPSKTASRNSCKTFQRDPTVGSIVMHLLTRFSSVIDGMGQTGCR